MTMMMIQGVGCMAVGQSVTPGKKTGFTGGQHRLRNFSGSPYHYSVETGRHQGTSIIRAEG